MENNSTTPFSEVYENFLSKITDDMYMELSKKETYAMLEDLLISSIPKFEFPKKNLFDYQKGFNIPHEDCKCDEDCECHGKDGFVWTGYFNCALTQEEINILSTYMIVEWIGQQLASIENIRMKYSGTDFKFTSQANHMQKLLVIKKDYEREGFHLQRLYKRRRLDDQGIQRSTFDTIVAPIEKR